METNEMGSLPVGRLLKKMSMPLIISMFVQVLYGLVDSLYVAQLGGNALTAISLCMPVQYLVVGVGTGIGVGVNSVLSKKLGEKDGNGVNKTAGNGFVLLWIVMVLFAVLGLTAMQPFYRIQTDIQEIRDMCISYSIVLCVCSFAAFHQIMMERLLAAIGRADLTMVPMLVGAVVNIILDPVMIFGWGPCPAMGIEGAAAATVIGQTLPVIAYLLICRRVPMSVEVGLKYLSERADVGRLYAVGVPATLNLALPSLLISALNAILGAFGQGYVLVLGAYYKLQTFLYLTANGIVQGMRPIIGYNRGAREFGRVREIYRTALWMSGAIMAVGTVICLLIPEQLMGLFSSSAETVAAGGAALRIICAGFLLSSVSITSCGALEGLGRGVPSLLISLCRYALVILPAAYLLSRSLGAAGVWHAFWVTEAVTAVVAFAVYRWQVRLCMAEQGVQGVQGEPDTAAG